PPPPGSTRLPYTTLFRSPISVGDFFAGALLPGMVLVALYVLYQIIIAWRRPESAPPVRGIDGEVGTGIAPAALLRALLPPVGLRSEEHTSELQSREKLVC